jgi:excisionase family DNA binding protein
MAEDRLYTIVEAAEFLGIPASTLARKATRGEAPHRRVFRHIRFSRQDLEQLQQVRGMR